MLACARAAGPRGQALVLARIQLAVRVRHGALRVVTSGGLVGESERVTGKELRACRARGSCRRAPRSPA